MRNHEDDGADQTAVQPAGAAQHQDDQQFGGTGEAERVKADELRGLRQQRAGHAGDGSADGKDGGQPLADIGANGRHAPPAFPYALQRQAERRIDHAAQHHEEDEQHNQAVDVRRLSVQVELEYAQQFAHHHAGQAVDAAGDERCLVGGLEQHQANAQRYHQPGQVLPAHDQKADQVAGQRGHRCGNEQPADRLAPAMHGQQACGVCPQAEESGMAQRDNAGVAEDQVERQREQADDHDLADQDQVAGKGEVGGDGQQPEHDFQRLPAVVGQVQLRGRESRHGGLRNVRFQGVGHGVHAFLRIRPAGNRISSTTISA